MNRVQCPVRPCDWTAPLQWEQRDQEGRTHMRYGQDELRAHLGQTHREELQLMLAGVDGGRGEPVVCTFTQHLDARQVEGAGDVVLSVLIPSMRAKLTAELAAKGLRPLDPWPAVQVRRYVWTTSPEWQAAMNSGDRPPGMRELELFELEDGQQPDLYQLELRTDAVQDTRRVQL